MISENSSAVLGFARSAAGPFCRAIRIAHERGGTRERLGRGHCRGTEIVQHFEADRLAFGRDRPFDVQCFPPFRCSSDEETKRRSFGTTDGGEDHMAMWREGAQDRRQTAAFSGRPPEVRRQPRGGAFGTLAARALQRDQAPQLTRGGRSVAFTTSVGRTPSWPHARLGFWSDGQIRPPLRASRPVFNGRLRWCQRYGFRSAAVCFDGQGLNMRSASRIRAQAPQDQLRNRQHLDRDA